jgi:chromosome segregation ATPase
MGDQAAAKGTPAAQLRWVPQRALLLKENQARKDADRHNALETDNKRLRESVEALERAKQKLENELKNKDRDLAEARSESDKMATKLKEMTDEHAHLLGGLTNKMRATEENAKGLLAIVRCVCSQWKNHPGGERV